MLDSGSRLGHFEILSTLGAGGMGEVYRARDPRLDREVAIKILPERFSENPEMMGRFEREAKALAALSHPNLLAIYDFGTDQGISYAVTELLKGETLRDRIKNARISWRKAAEIGAAIASGLSAAHSQGIIHRDLKPENIFLTSEGHLKILDFGLAYVPNRSEQKGLNFETEPGCVIGTCQYMSPEQVNGVTADARSDIFALGCLLFEMLTGRSPFLREKQVETMIAVLKDDPPDILESDKKIPQEFNRLVRRCLEKNPEERFQSVKDLAFDLTVLANLSGTRRTTFDSILKPARIRVAVAGLLAAIVLFIYLISYPRPLDSIAVLPFENVGGDSESEYLSDGITEDVIYKLSQMPGLRVIARNTVFRYKGNNPDPLEAGRQLNVQAVLTGRVIRDEEVLTIQVDLIRVHDGSQIWGQKYKKRLSEMHTLWREFSSDLIYRLRVNLSASQQEKIAKRSTENTEAYLLYLKGRYCWNKRTPDGLKKGIEYFREAIENDPTYALAYSGLADCYCLLSEYGVLPPGDTFPRARGAAKQALQIDDELAEAHASLGAALHSYDWNWPAARQEYDRAIELNPNYATVHHWYALYFVTIREFEKAKFEMQKALDLEPLSPVINTGLAWPYYFEGKYDPAEEKLQKSMELTPDFFLAHWGLGLVNEQKKKFPEAISAFQRAVTLSGEGPVMLAALGHAYAVSGQTGEATKIIEELQEKSKQRYVSPYFLAAIYAGLGDKDRALALLQEACAQHSDWLIYLGVDPRFYVLRSDPRFTELLQRVGIPLHSQSRS